MLSLIVINKFIITIKAKRIKLTFPSSTSSPYSNRNCTIPIFISIKN